MKPITEWARRHGVSLEAVRELLEVLVPAAHTNHSDSLPDSEAYVQSAVRLEAPRYGVWLTRNNVGALQDKTGRPVRYGLANETKEQNKAVKSADLIGLRPVLITPHHVGHTIGQFVSRECKHAGWRPGEDVERETAQLNWVRLITRYGGDAKIVSGPGSFAR